MLLLTDSPAWVTSITDPTKLKQVLREHINAVLGRYGKNMYAFDVVNEREWETMSTFIQLNATALNEDGTWKSSVWYNILGEDYIGIAVGSHLPTPTDLTA